MDNQSEIRVSKLRLIFTRCVDQFGLYGPSACPPGNTYKIPIEWNNNIRTVQSESSKFASLLFDQIPNRRVVGTDGNAIC